MQHPSSLKYFHPQCMQATLDDDDDKATHATPSSPSSPPPGALGQTTQLGRRGSTDDPRGKVATLNRRGSQQPNLRRGSVEPNRRSSAESPTSPPPPPTGRTSDGLVAAGAALRTPGGGALAARGDCGVCGAPVYVSQQRTQDPKTGTYFHEACLRGKCGVSTSENKVGRAGTVSDGETKNNTCFAIDSWVWGGYIRWPFCVSFRFLPFRCLLTRFFV